MTKPAIYAPTIFFGLLSWLGVRVALLSVHGGNVPDDALTSINLASIYIAIAAAAALLAILVALAAVQRQLSGGR